jgi:hypothetical protein
MKKIITLFASLLFLQLHIFSQKSLSETDALKEQYMTWYGLDFTHCKFIGEPAIHGNFYKAPDYVVRYFFRDWNMIPVNEGSKYQIAASYGKDGLYYDIDTLLARNGRYNSDSLIARNFRHSINSEFIPDIIKTYNGVSKEGLGMAFIVETYDHQKEEASYYSVIFDIASKKIFYLEHIIGKPSGGSVKTYWAGAFRNALEKNKKIYKRWKKETMKKNNLES